MFMILERQRRSRLRRSSNFRLRGRDGHCCGGIVIVACGMERTKCLGVVVVFEDANANGRTCPAVVLRSFGWCNKQTVLTAFVRNNLEG